MATPAPSPTTLPPSDNDTPDLSNGQVGAIIAALVIVPLLIALGIVFLKRRRDANKPSEGLAGNGEAYQKLPKPATHARWHGDGRRLTKMIGATLPRVDKRITLFRR